ncbi:zf-DNL-domain-containing protein, partial [Aspergillus sclerotioniger CBS 115572]
MHSFTSLVSRGLRGSLPRAAATTTTTITSTTTTTTSISSRHFSNLLTRQRHPSHSPIHTRLSAHLLRHNSSSTAKPTSNPLTNQTTTPETDAQNAEQNRLRREQEPAYQITFTCKPCGNRSSHRMSKHGYHRGTVLIRCPSCENRHVISDHLNIFFDKKSTLEDILAKQGGKVKRGYVNGDMEFWEDGSVNVKEG